MVVSPTGDIDAVVATIDSLLRHGIKMDSRNLSACAGVFEDKDYYDQKPGLAASTHLQFLLDGGADLFRDGGPIKSRLYLAG
jgi:hypothetical protein